MHILEIDISDKFNCVLKYGLIVLLITAAVCSGVIFYFNTRNKSLSIMDAEVMGNVSTVRSRAKGTITEILVDDGEMVEAGALVARLHVSVTEDEIKKLEDALETAKNNLQTIEAGVTVTREVYSGSSMSSEAALSRMERMNELYAIGAISERERDNAVAEYQASSYSGDVSYQTFTQAANPESIKSAEFRVRQAEAALKAAQQESGATDVYAPVRGSVFLTDVKAGSDVKQGEPIMNIGDASSVWVDMFIDKKYKDELHLGQYVSSSINGHEYKGSIVDISEPSPESSKSSRNDESDSNVAKSPRDDKLKVRASLTQGDSSVLRPGMRAKAQISLD